jgi:hypothetical protein
MSRYAAHCAVCEARINDDGTAWCHPGAATFMRMLPSLAAQMSPSCPTSLGETLPTPIHREEVRPEEWAPEELWILVGRDGQPRMTIDPIYDKTADDEELAKCFDCTLVHYVRAR